MEGKNAVLCMRVSCRCYQSDRPVRRTTTFVISAIRFTYNVLRLFRTRGPYLHNLTSRGTSIEACNVKRDCRKKSLTQSIQQDTDSKKEKHQKYNK